MADKWFHGLVIYGYGFSRNTEYHSWGCGLVGRNKPYQVSFLHEAGKEDEEYEADEKELNVMRTLVDSLKERIEQQDAKIKMLNEKVDFLYEEKHKLERENNGLVRENAMLKIQLAQAERDMCVRPDDECMKRQPPRDHCRLKRLARGYYDKFYTADELAKGEADCDEEDKKLYGRKEETGNADSGVSEKPDKGE